MENQNLMAVAEKLIVEFYNREYAHSKTEEKLDLEKDIPLAYTELGGNNEFPVQVYVNLKELKVKYEITDENGAHMIPELEETYSSLCELIDEFLEYLDFDDLILPFYDYIPEEEE